MDVRAVARLAHLNITNDEVEIYSPQMADIVKYVEQLNELDTTTVEPMLGGLTAEGESTSADRGDEVQQSLPRDEALGEAPAAVAGHFQVPKVL